MKHSLQHTQKWKTVLIVLLSLFSMGKAFAQCPTPNPVTIITKTDEQCYQAEDGTITFQFKDGTYPSVFDYRVQLYEFDTGTFVYDDNNPAFLNSVPAPTISGDLLTFASVPPGDYALILSGGACGSPSPSSTYGLNFSGLPNSAVRIDAATEIIINPASVVTTGDTQCIGPFDGEIDVNGVVSGGTGTYEYSIDGGGSYQPSVVFNDLEDGTYTVRVKDSNGCEKDIAGIVVDDLSNPPTATISPNPAEACININLVLDGNPAGGTPGYTHIWTGDTGPLSATNVVNPDFNAGAAGTFNLTYTVTDAKGCTGTDNITVNVNNPPSAGTDNTIDVCATDNAVNLFGSLGGTPDGGGVWSDNDGTGALAAGVFDATGVAVPGTYHFTYTVSGTGCPNAAATVTVNVNEAPDAGTDNTIEVCVTDNGVNLFGSLGGTPDGGGSWNDDDGTGALAAGIFDATAVIAPGIYHFTYTVSGTGCPDATATVTVNVNVAPDAGTDNTIDVCATDNAVNLFASLGGTPDGGGVWSDDDGTGMLSVDEFDATGVAVPGTYHFTYTVSGTGCPDATAIVTVNVNEAPDAGTDNTIDVCATDDAVDLFASLGGTPDGGGVWSDDDGTGMLSGDEFDATGVVVPGTYHFTYTVSGTGCPDATAIVTVNVNEAPDAGTDNTIEVCATDNSVDLFASLGGTPDGGGVWNDDDGSGALAAGVFDATAVIALGTYHFTYTVSGIGCPDASATVTVSVNEAPDAGTDNTIEVCATDNAVDLFGSLGGTPDAGGVWSDDDGTGMLSGDEFDATGVVAPGTYHFTYTVSGTGCPDATATVTVNVNVAPDAGTDNTIDVCATDDAVDLFASLGGTPDGGGAWSDNDGTGALAAGIFDATAVIAPGTYHFTYTVSGTGCPDATAIVTVNVHEAPDAGTDNTIEVCATDNAVDLFTSLGGTPDGGGAWSDDDGTGMLSVDEFDATGVAVPGTYHFTYTVSGTGCPDATAIVTVNVHEAPDAGTDNTIEVCATDNAVDLFGSLGGTPDAGGVWSDDDGTGMLSVDEFDATGVAIPGTYHFTYTVSGTGCPDATAIVTVNVHEAPDAGTDNTIDVCATDDAVSLFGGLGGTPNAGGVWNDDDGTGMLSVDEFDATGVAVPGTYHFTYTVSGTGCPDATAIVTVNVHEAPDAGDDNTVPACNTEANFDLFASLGGTPDAGGTWSDNDGSGAVITGNTVDLSGLVAGDYNFTYTVSGTGCPDATATVTVQVSESPNAGDDGSLTACTAETSLDLTGGLSGAAQPGGIWSDDDGTGELTGSIFDPQAADVGTYHFTYTIAGVGACPASSAVITVNVVTAPNAGDDGALDACTTEANVDLFTGLGGTPDAGGTWDDLDGTGALSGETFDASQVVAGTYNFRYGVTTAGCGDDEAFVSVTVHEAPDAGTDNTENVCITQTAFDLNTALSGTAQPGGTWNDDDGTGELSGSDFNASAANLGTYHFTYTVAGTGTCPDASALITINVVNAPDAGNDNAITVCEVDNSIDLFANLGGTPDAGGTWSDDDGTGMLLVDEFDATGVTAPGTYQFTYTVSAAGCGSDMATVTVEVIATPDAGTNNIVDVCETETEFDLNTALSGTAQAGGTWSDDDGTGELSANLFDAQAAGAGAYHFTYTVAGTASCPDATALITVNVLDAPDAGTDNTIDVCETETTVDLFANLGGTPDGGGTWNDDDGTGALSGGDLDVTALLAPGPYHFTYTVNGGATCADASATVTVNVDEGPTVADAGEDAKACNLTAVLDGNEPAIGTGQWTQILGPGTLTFDDPASHTSTVTADVAGVYELQWETTNGGCASQDIVEIEFADPIEVSFFSYNPAYSGSMSCDDAPEGGWATIISGGFGGYSFDWSNGETSQHLLPFDNPPGVYSVEVTDSEGCEGIGVTAIGSEIDNSPELNFVETSAITCAGGGDGSITVEITHGASTTPGPGKEYELLVMDENGNIIQPLVPIGIDALTVSFPLNGLGAGDYFVSVRDKTLSGLCATQAAQVTLSAPAPITFSNEDITDVDCQGAETGRISVDVSGGTTPYTFEWTDGEGNPVTSTETGNTTVIENLPADSYQLTVTDNAGCQEIAIYEIEEPSDPDPAPVTTSATDIECTSLTVHWDDLTGATEYYLDVSEDADFSTFLPGYENKDMDADLEEVITGLTPNTTIYYRVSAEMPTCGETVHSNESSATTAPNEPAPDVTTPPYGVTQVGCDFVEISWGDVAGANYYEVDVSLDDFNTPPATTNVGLSTTHIFPGLSPNQDVFIRVRANTACGDTEDSETITITTEDVPPAPNVDAGFTNIGCDNLTVNWGQVPGAIRYILEVSDDGFATNLPGYDNIDMGLALNETIGGLNMGDRIYYRVRAETSCGETQNSTELDAYTADMPGVPVAEEASNIGCNSLDANWEEVIGVNITYKIDVSLEADFSTFLVQDVDVTTTTYTINGLNPGDFVYYRVRAVNDCGTSPDYSDVITARALMPAECGFVCTFDATAVGGNVTCDGDTDGNIVVFVISGGSGDGNYLYKLADDPTYSTFTGGFISEIENLAQGNYAVEIRDDVTGCIDNATVAVGVGTTLFASVDKENISCDGGTGSISLLVAGGSGDYSFAWTGPNGYTANTKDITGLTEGGDYVVEITEITDDGNGCVAQFTVNLTAPANFTLAPVVTNESCGAGDGAITIGADGPNAFIYTGDLIQDVTTGLSEGTYEVTITDVVTGCSTDMTYTVENDVDFTFDVVVDPVSCGATNDGSIEITVTGPNTYTVSGDITTTSATGLAEGDYNVTITDDVTGCEKNTVISVGVNTDCGAGCGLDVARFTIDPVNANCPGGNDGALLINLLPGSGVDPARFNYSMDPANGWNAGGTSPGLVYAFDELTTGEYDIYIQDTEAGAGCDTEKITTRTIVSQNNIEISTQAESCEANDGSITLTVPATCVNSSNYTYIWRDANANLIGVDITTASDLAAGNYSILIQDSNLGSTIETLEVNVENNCSNGGGGGGELCMLGNKSVDVATTPFDCENEGGSVTLSVIGGAAVEYNFRIVSTDGLIDLTDTETGSVTFSGLPSGNYEYRVIDNSGSPSCQSTFTIGENSVIISSVGITMPGCNDPIQEASLLVTLDVATTAAGPYEVFAFSSENPDDPVAQATIADGLNNVTLNGLPIGTVYEIQVHSADTRACAATREVTVPTGEIVEASFEYSADDIVCFGDGGVISITNIVASEDSPFTLHLYQAGEDEPLESKTYQFIPSIHLFNDLPIGDFRVQLEQEQNVCGGVTVTESSPAINIHGPVQGFNAEVPDEIEVTVDNPVGTIQVNNITGGGKPYEVRILTDPAGGSTDWIEVVNDNPFVDPYAFAFDNMDLGNYTIEVRDAFGCSIIRDVKVRYTIDLFIPNIFTPNNDGENDSFEIVNLDLYTQGDEGANIIITNRWGTVVYESKSYTNQTAWDGEEYPDGVYFYRLIMPNDGGTFTGWIELWRGRRP